MIKSHIPLLAALLGGFALGTTAHADEPVNFEKQILPIFEAKCMSCHASEHTDESTGRVKRPKGGLVLDNADAILKGGKESGDKTMIAGKADESPLYVSTTLPPSDDMAMPPEGKADPLTVEELALLKKWIDSGADFGGWKGKE